MGAHFGKCREVYRRKCLYRMAMPRRISPFNKRRKQNKSSHMLIQSFSHYFEGKLIAKPPRTRCRGHLDNVIQMEKLGRYALFARHYGRIGANKRL